MVILIFFEGFSEPCADVDEDCFDVKCVFIRIPCQRCGRPCTAGTVRLLTRRILGWPLVTAAAGWSVGITRACGKGSRSAFPRVCIISHLLHSWFRVHGFCLDFVQCQFVHQARRCGCLVVALTIVTTTSRVLLLSLGGKWSAVFGTGRFPGG
jgi:hypothetical protein